MISNLTNLFEACEMNKNQRFSTCDLSLAQYHMHNALWLASLGYYVFPVSGQKIPFKGFKWKELSTKDTNAINEYWQKYPYGRIAIDCEKSGITVVDVDNKPEKNKHGLKILADCLKNWGDFAENAPVIISPSGGLHIYFKDSQKQLMRCYADCIDIQRPHYVLAPTSLNAQNGLYKIYNNFLPQADLSELPDEWLTQLVIKSEIQANKKFQPIKKKVLDIDVAPLYEKCSFFRHCIEEAEELPEYLWFEFAKFLSSIANGEELFHKYSEKHPAYDYAETQSKFNRAKIYPFKCQAVRHMFDGCRGCSKQK